MSKNLNVLIRVAQGRSYVNVLGRLRKNADSVASRTRVSETRPTKKENTLIKIGGLSNKVYEVEIT